MIFVRVRREGYYVYFQEVEAFIYLYSLYEWGGGGVEKAVQKLGSELGVIYGSRRLRNWISLCVNFYIFRRNGYLVVYVNMCGFSILICGFVLVY